MPEKRRASVWALCLMVVATLAIATGCGSSDDTSSDTSAAGASSAPATTSAGDAGIEQAKAAVAQYSKEQPPLDIPPLPGPAGKKTAAWVFCTLPTCQADAAKKAFTALGWHFKLVPWDFAKAPADFVKAFENALQMKPAFIGVPMVFPPEIIAKQMAEAKAAGIPVIHVTSTTGVGDDVIACMSCAPQLNKTARLQVDVALADAGGKTGIVYGYDPTLLTFVEQFLPAAKDEVNRLSPESSYDTLKLSLAQPPARNAAAIVNYVQRHPDVKYVLLAASELAAGLPQALSAAGLSDKVKFITQAPQPTDLKEIANGQEFASVAAEDASSIWRAADAAARYAIDKKIPDDLVYPVGWHQIVTKDNVPKDTSTLVQPTAYQETFKKAWNVAG
jgi:ribose transport system substrate-binding protein